MAIKFRFWNCECSQRYVMAVFCAFGILIMAGQGDNLTAGIAIGLRKTGENDSTNTSFNQTVSDVNLETIDWSDIILHIVMFAYTIGFLGGQIPAGYFSDRIGARWVYFVGAAASTTLTLFMPITLTRSPYILVFCSRIFLGVCHSVIYTCTSTLLANWIPSSERSSIGGLIFGVYPLATTSRRVVSDSLRLKIENWSVSLYFWGSCGLIWCGLYVPLIYSRPEKHPHIRQGEKDFLDGKVARKVDFPVPSKKMMKDRDIWTLIVGQIGQNFAMRLMTGSVPWFLMGNRDLSMKEMNLLVVLTFFGTWLVSILTGIVVDYGVSRRKWNLKWSRRIMMYISVNVSSVCLCLLYYFRNSESMAITLFALSGVAIGPYFSSFCVNHLDISLHFAGIIQGAVICMGEISCLLVAFAVRTATITIIWRAWEIDTWVSFSLCFITSMYYLLRARAKRAAWDVPPEET